MTEMRASGAAEAKVAAKEAAAAAKTRATESVATSAGTVEDGKPANLWDTSTTYRGVVGGGGGGAGGSFDSGGIETSAGSVTGAPVSPPTKARRGESVPRSLHGAGLMEGEGRNVALRESRVRSMGDLGESTGASDTAPAGSLMGGSSGVGGATLLGLPRTRPGPGSGNPGALSLSEAGKLTLRHQQRTDTGSSHGARSRSGSEPQVWVGPNRMPIAAFQPIRAWHKVSRKQRRGEGGSGFRMLP